MAMLATLVALEWRYLMRLNGGLDLVGSLGDGSSIAC